MEDVCIVSAVRTPIGAYLGALREVPAYDLVALVLNEVVKKAKVDPVKVDEVIIGQCYQSGEYVNIARMGLLTAGWPVTVPGITLDRRCTSGLDAVIIGAMQIQTGASEIVVAGGVESMSNAEFYIPGSIKWGIGRGSGISFPDAPRGHGSLQMFGIPIYDRIQRSRPNHQPQSRFGTLVSNMAWAEKVAKELNISREECDKWALRSHQRAIAAIDAGKFKDYIVPVPIPQEKGPPKMVETDEGPRRDTSLEALARLRPVLDGVCTAGNSSQENDAAAVFVLTTTAKAKELGVEPMAYLKSWAKAADDPWNPPKAGTKAFKLALEKAKLTVRDIDLFEIQEAFAAQCLYNIKTLGVPEELYDRINVNGSGISLGHPLGATLALRLCGLAHELKKRSARYGLVGTPGAGAISVAAVFERR